MLPKTYIHRPGTMIQPNDALLGHLNVSVLDTRNGGAMTTKPCIKGYAFDTVFDYISYLENEGTAILATPEFDATDKSQNYHYDFLKSLATCGDTLTEEYNSDLTVLDSVLLEKGKVARREYRDRGLLKHVTQALTTALSFPYPSAEAARSFLETKTLFSQYVAIAQENQDLNAIKTAFSQLQKIYSEKFPKDATFHGDIEDLTGIAYLGADGIIRQQLDAATVLTAKKAVKEGGPHAVYNRMQQGQKEKLWRETVLPEAEGKITNALQAVLKDNLPESKDGTIGKGLVEASKYLDELGELGFKNYLKSQDPETDAIKAGIGQCAFVEKEEKVGISDLGNGLAIIISTKKDITDKAGKLIAPKGTMCVTCQNKNSYNDNQINTIIDCFLAKYEGLKFEDLGIYIVGGRGEEEEFTNFLKNHKKPGSPTHDEEYILNNAGTNALLLSKVLTDLQTRPVTIEGTCLYKKSQPLAFTVQKGPKGNPMFAPGRPKHRGEIDTAIDFVGAWNFNSNLCDIAAAPWLKDTPPVAYIAPDKTGKYVGLMNYVHEHRYVDAIVNKTKSSARNAPIAHSLARQFINVNQASLDATVHKAWGAYMTTPQGQRIIRSTCKGDASVLSEVDYTGRFGLFIGEPHARRLNDPVYKAIAVGNLFNAKLELNLPPITALAMEQTKAALRRTVCDDPHQKEAGLRHEISSHIKTLGRK